MFIITDTRHRDCDECRGQASRAVTTARISGSVGSTYGTRGESVDEHWATVRRVVDPDAEMLELRHPLGHYDNDPLP